MSGVLEVPALDLCLAISRALDLPDPFHPTHHLQTAFLTSEIAEYIGLPQNEAEELLLASLIHDFGLLLEEEEETAYEFSTPPSPARHRHAVLAYLLLQELEIVRELAPNVPRIILYHHLQLRELSNPDNKFVLFRVDDTVKGAPLTSFILHLAGEVSRALDNTCPILQQRIKIVERVKELKGSIFPPDIVDAFVELSQKEALWLSLTSPMLCHFIRYRFPCQARQLNLEEILAISRLLCDMVDLKSSSTSVHSFGVAVTAEGLAKLLGLPAEHTKMLKIAGYLHDLGKLYIPSKILEKKGKLTEEEKEMILAHPYHTYDILSNIRGFQQISQWAGYHHERLDGSGYPFHLKGDELPVEARILAVADIFTALGERRPYRPAMPREKVLMTIKEEVSNKKLDPEIVNELAEHYDELEANFLNVQFISMQRYREFWQKLSTLLFDT